MKTLLLIDANSLIHRMFHALPPLTSPAGAPTQSLYGMSSVLLKLFREEKPDYAAAAFDRPEPTFRRKAYAAYKAQRPKAPDELVSQINEARKVFAVFGIKTFEASGFEADDIIATLSSAFAGKSVRVVILTGDLDTLQLVADDAVMVRTFRRGVSDTFLYNEAAVHERFGLSPKQLTDYKALVGDPSDNVRGVPGVGPKTASELLRKYGTLEKLLAETGDTKVKEKILPFAKELELSKFLVTLKCDVPLPAPSLEELAVADVTPETLRDYFSRMGFESLLRRISEGGTPPRPRGRAKARPPAPRQKGIFGFGENGPADEALPAGQDDIVAIDESVTEKELSSAKIKTGFFLKDLFKALWDEGRDMAAPYADISVAYWLLEPDLGAYEPEALSQLYLKRGWGGSKEEVIELFARADSRLKKLSMGPLFWEVEMPVLKVLAAMERRGIAVSPVALRTLENEIAARIKTASTSMYQLAGGEFNLNSPRQLSEVLYRRLHLEPKRNAKTSTSAARLELLKDAHPIVPLVLEYRENFKILSTYVRPLQELADDTGRVHTQFVQTGTGTGRLSSQSPNLQNIPRESSWSRRLRQAFVAAAGFSFAAFDYSQIELRILAAVSGDRTMIEAFARGTDIHRETAARVLGISPEAVSPQQRRLAKTLNFGLVYGMGAAAFAQTAGISQGDAKALIDAYFKSFAGVRAWQKRVKEEMRQSGFTQTLTGRRRYFPHVNSGHPQAVAAAERAAVNHPIQGLGADLMKIAMIRCQRALAAAGHWQHSAHLILSIHDELLFEVRDDKIQEVAQLVSCEMERAYALPGVALRVEASCGKTWGDLAPLASA